MELSSKTKLEVPKELVELKRTLENGKQSTPISKEFTKKNPVIKVPAKTIKKVITPPKRLSTVDAENQWKLHIPIKTPNSPIRKVINTSQWGRISTSVPNRVEAPKENKKKTKISELIEEAYGSPKADYIDDVFLDVLQFRPKH